MSPRAVHVGLPLDEPKPAPRCKECARLAGLRDQARAEGDGASVSDCNIRIRRHPHEPTR